MRVFVIVSCLWIVTSCTKNAVYLRHTDFHHVHPSKLKVTESKRDSVFFSITSISMDSETKTTVYEESLKDTNFTYLENKRVIRYYGSYYIRSNVKSKRIMFEYYNRDIEF